MTIDRRDFMKGTIAAAAATTAGATLTPESSRVDGFKLAYAPHLGMFRHHAEDIDGQIDAMANYGFTALEDNDMRGRSTEEQNQIVAALERHDMRMGVFVANEGGFGPPILTKGPGEERDRFLQNIRDSVEVAKRVNATWMTVVPGEIHPRLDDGYQTASVIEALKQASAIFEPHELVMVCEPLNWRDHAKQFLRRTDQSYMIMKAVDSPACKILYDAYHQQITEGNLIPNIEMAWDEIAYFQVGDNPGRNEPTTGEVNYRNVFRAIHRRGFHGIVGMEHGVSQPGRDGEVALVEAYRWCDDFDA